MSAQRPKVSVIIPTFNRVRFVLPTIHCALKQSFPLDYEVVVVDSGTDDTESLINQHFPEMVQYHRLPESRNRSRLRNNGANLAKGEYLLFIDSDILLDPNHLQVHWKLHEAAGDQTILTMSKRRALVEFGELPGSISFLEQHFGSIESFSWIRDFREPSLNSGLHLNEYRAPWRFVYSHNMMINRSAFIASRGFDELFGDNWGYEDIELGFRLHQAGVSFFLLEEVPVYHLPHLEQSRMEQPLAIANAVRLTNLYPLGDVELVARWGIDIDTELQSLVSASNKYQNLPEVSMTEDLCLAVPIMRERASDFDRFRLGAFLLDRPPKSVKVVLISEAFGEYPVSLQLSILTEAYRVACTVCIRRERPELLGAFVNAASYLGWRLSLAESGQNTEVSISARGVPRILNVVVPSTFEVTKRLFWLRLALRLEGEGYLVNLIESKGALDYEESFGGFSVDEIARLKQMQKCKTRALSGRFVISERLAQGKSAIEVGPGSLVVDDDGYNTQSQSVARLNHATSSDFNASLMAGSGPCRAISNSSTRVEPGTIMYSMFSGYLEDNLDSVLTAISGLASSKIKMAVFVPSPESLLRGNYSRHNLNSKRLHMGAYLNKVTNDVVNLKLSIHQLGLSEVVSVVPVSSDDDLVRELTRATFFLSIPAGSSLTFVAMLAINLGLVVAISDAVALPPTVSDKVHHVPMKCNDFSTAFGLPLQTSTAGLVSYQPESIEALQKVIHDVSAIQAFLINKTDECVSLSSRFDPILYKLSEMESGATRGAS